jgi:hypothetical protein
MAKTEDSHWHCGNRDCGWSAVMSLSSEEQMTPRCICGAPMTRTDMPPVFSYLDFLRGEEALHSDGSLKKE